MTAKKTDRVDAKKLADCLKLRMRFAQYQRVTAQMTALKNNLHALFRQWLVQTDKGLIIEKLEDYLKHPRLPPEAASIAKAGKEAVRGACALP